MESVIDGISRNDEASIALGVEFIHYAAPRSLLTKLRGFVNE